MPNAFSLTRKSDPAAGPTPLAKIDEEICQMLGVDVDPKLYAFGWYDVIGFRLAMGQSFAQIKAEVQNYKPMPQICDWLEENFVPDAWYSPKC